MLFNSISFLVFFLIVFIVYWFVLNKKTKLQNILLLVSSYVFYGWWDWRFLSLIFISSLSDYIIGLKLGASNKLAKRKMWVTLSVIINLSILAFFKYYNFFVDNFIELFSLLGISLKAQTLNIILPVGISFYTFQTMSYTLDIYREQLKPTKDFVSFFAFVSFFPQLVAGPIERASNLLSQFYAPREFSFEKSAIAMRQILWGLFQKIVVADNCGILVDRIFESYQHQSGLTLIFGGILFSVQIYGDFAGYSNIAIGVSRLLGFQLMNNFHAPFFSQNITEIWRRWHISLSTWLRDYLYTPIAIKTRNWGKMGLVFSTMVTFLLCGLWHGANWTYVLFGFFHGLALSYEILTKKTRKKWKKKISKSIYVPLSILITFLYWTFTHIIFRSTNSTEAFNYLKSMFFNNFISIEKFRWPEIRTASIIIVLFFILIDFWGRKNQFALETLGNKWNKAFRYIFYSFLVFLIIMLYQTNSNPFIYFQF